MRLTYFLKESKGITGVIGLLLLINLFIYGYLAGSVENSQKVVFFRPKIVPIKTESQTLESVPKSDKNLVASKSGTKVYYVWCSGVSRIKPENKVFFDTVDEALNKGYTKASNCPGL
jgi:hypothetical protein